MNDNFKYKKLTPFKWFVLENFPFIEADFDAITDWQLFCKLGEEINKIINSTNILGTQVETLTDFVSNYFDNLDVQEEINNKLDEMAEGGQLEEIIAEYLQMAGLLCYNTVNDMKNATNLINGSFAKTFGKTTYNDGLGEFYKIRTVTNTDVIDNINIIALNNSTTLIAELIPNAKITAIQTEINNIVANNLTELVVVGDSYTALSTSNWAELVASQLHLNLHKHGTSSMGFVRSVGGQTFINNLSWGESQEIKNKTKYVICYGGINDKNENVNTLYTNVKAFCESAKTMYPNAQILIVGPQSSATNTAGFLKIINAMQKACSESGVAYSNAFDWLFNTQFNYTETYDSDNIHPSALGYKIIAGNMLNLLFGNPLKNNFITFETIPELENSTNFRVSHNNNLCSLLCTVDNITLPNNSFVTILNSNAPFKEFIPGNQYFPVYSINTQYSFADKLIGFASFNSSFTALRVVNITGQSFTGKIGLRADIMTYTTN